MATTPYPRTLTAYPTPVLGGTPDFFHQNDRKGCKRDYLDVRGHFVLRFGAIGKKPLGGVPPPLGRRWLILTVDTLMHATPANSFIPLPLTC